ncbi:MAG: hypothetical protein LW884_10165 [Bacteroidetes bacterium]|jgi:hypothetical protein|nr:hypothetical protein [Bacteroidota bacterium]
MIERILNILRAVRYSLPMQLLLTQIRSHKLVLLTWVFVILIITQQILNNLGGGYLFLEPEYMNQVNFASMFILGISFGIFSLAFQMTCYILDGYRFFFLGLERRPFMTFSINNSFIPLLFWLIYSISYISFHSHNDQVDLSRILLNLLGAILGGILVTTLSVLYFSVRNKDVIKLFGEKIVQELRSPSLVVREARRTLGQLIRVDWFFVKFTKVERVQKNIKGDLRYLIRVLNQNQANALILQVMLLLALISLGIFQDNPYFKIPAAASFMLLFSFLIMIIGAVTFWSRKVGPATILALLGIAFFINQFEPFVGDNYAFGLNYEKEWVDYNYPALREIAKPEHVQADSLYTVQMLQNWKAKNWQPGQPLPKLVLVAVSGGGNRSALWTTRALQTLDAELEGKLHRQTALITGASGGMIGVAYWRELVRQSLSNSQINPNDPIHLERVSKDLLNPIVLNLTTNLFIPNLVWEYGGRAYEKDRGYAFEGQLNENLPQLRDLQLKDYRDDEYHARIPAMIFSPTIGNDGRHLYISPHSVSYLMKSHQFNNAYRNEITGVDFQRLFAAHGADGLRFTTAIRMNATFPTLLPYVELPTRPAISVLDAGVLDNFGVNTTTRFLFCFREWIEANTSGIMMILIRDTQREQKVLENRKKTILNKIASMFGGPITGYSKGKDFLNDEMLERTQAWMGVPMDVVELQYIPAPTFKGAALSFHLTDREKQDILNAMYNEENQLAVKRIKEFMSSK